MLTTNPPSGTGRQGLDSDAAGPEAVGAMLQARREELGRDLRQVADSLRIRHPYLEAIESGRVEDLPGPTYAIGFVRAYADYLGFDGEHVVASFKQQNQGLENRAQLNFPSPLSEARIPSGTVVLVAVVLAALVYGGWVYLSSPDRRIADEVPELPDNLSMLLRGESATPAAVPDPALGPAPDPAPNADERPAAPNAEAPPAEAPPAEASSVEALPVERSAPARPTVTVSELASVPPAESPAPAGSPAPAEERPASRAESEPDLTLAPNTTALPAEAGTLDTGPPAAPVARVAALPDAPFASENEQRIYGDENVGARVVIRATSDSWIEVRDERSGELLFTRVLRNGDTYRVPARSGLSLVTGNAGGIQISVDGAPIPPVGPLGSVRRNLALDPDALRSLQTAN